MPRKRNSCYDITPDRDAGLDWCLPERQWLTFDAERPSGSNSWATWRSVRRKIRAFAIAQTLANRSGHSVEVSQRVKRRGELMENVWIVEPGK